MNIFQFLYICLSLQTKEPLPRYSTTISILERILNNESFYVNKYSLMEKLGSTQTGKWVVQRLFDVVKDVIEILKCEHNEEFIILARGVYEQYPFRSGPLCKSVLTSCFLLFIDKMEDKELELELFLSNDLILEICSAIEGDEDNGRVLACTVYDLLCDTYAKYWNNNIPIFKISYKETVILALLVKLHKLGTTHARLESFMLQNYGDQDFGFKNNWMNRIPLRHTEPHAYIFLAENIKDSVYRKTHLVPIQAWESKHYIYKLERPFGISTAIKKDVVDNILGIDFKLTKTFTKWLIDILQYYSIVFNELTILKLTKLDGYYYNIKVIGHKNYYDKEFIDAYLDSYKCINDKTAEMKIEISRRIQSGKHHSFMSVLTFTEYFFTEKEEEAEFKNERCLQLSCGHFLGLETIKEWFISGVSRCMFCNKDSEVECYFEHHVTTKKQTTVN